MSRAIDEKIVSMQFDNKQFEQGAKETMSMLDRLKRALEDSIGTQAFDGIDRAAARVDLTGIQNGVEALANRFSTLGIVAMRVIENITDALMSKLSGAIHAITDSIVSGGIRRAMNIENAHFQLQGLIDDEKEVQAIMDAASKSVDGTAYSYDAAAKAASMFAATGMRAGEEMDIALKAIAGVAATTNSDYESLSMIFTTISGQGRVMADQLNQLASRGMNAAAALTDYFNKVNKGEAEASEGTKKAIKELTKGLDITEADLREFVSDSKISFNIFSEAMGRTFGDHAKDANKTFNGALSNIKAAFARTGAAFVTPLIKQEGPLVKMFNAIRVKVNDLNKTLAPLAETVTTKINGAIEDLTKKIRKLDLAKKINVYDEETKKWKRQYDGLGSIMQNFFNVLDSAKNIVMAISSVLKPIHNAFKETFDFKSLDVTGFTQKLKDFTQGLILTEDQSDKLQNKFKKVFNFIKKGIKEAIDLGKNAFNFVKNLTPSLQPLLKIAQSLEKFFDKALSAFLNTIHKINDAIKNADYGKLFDNLRNAVDNVSSAFSKLIDIITNISFEHTFKGFGGIFGWLEKGMAIFKKAVDAFKPVFEELWKILTQDPSKAANSIITGTLFVTAGRMLSKAQETIKSLNRSLDNITNVTSNITKPIQNALSLVGNASKTLGNLSGVLLQMQQNLKVGVLLEIAKAILMMAGAMLIMDSVDPDKLIITMGSIVTLLGTLSGVMLIINNLFSTVDKFAELKKKHPLIGAISGFIDSLSGIMDAVKFRLLVKNLMTFAEAVLLLSVAMKILSTMSLEELLEGLVAVGVLMFELTVLLDHLSKMNGPAGLTRIGIGLISIALAINILASAVRKLGELDFGTLLKGLGSVGAILLGFSLFVSKTSTSDSMIDIGIGMMAIAVAIKILESSVRAFGRMKWNELIKGLGSVAAILLSMGVFLKLGGGASKMISTAAGMMLIAVAIKMLVEPLKAFGDMSIKDAIQSVIMFDIVLGEMVTVLRKKMPSATQILAKAVGMILLAEAIKMLVEPLNSFGAMSLGDAVQSVVMLGVVLGVLTSTLQEKMPKPVAIIAKATGIIMLAEAVKMLVEPLKSFGSMSIGDALQAVLMLDAVLIELVWVIKKLPDDLLKLVGKAAAMIILAESVKMIASAMVQLGGLGLEGAISAVVAFGGAMLILCTALKSLEGMNVAGLLVSVLSMVGIAFALKLIAPAFQMLGNMNWEQIGRACAAMAAAFGILIAAFGIAGALSEFVGIGAAIIIASLMGFALVLGTVVSIITKAITGLSNGVNAIVESVKSLADADATKCDKACDIIGKALTTIGESLKKFGILAPVGAKALRIAAEGIAILSPALKDFAEVIDPNNKVGLDFMFMKLTDGFKYLADGLKHFKLTDFLTAEALKSVAEGVAVLAPAMAQIMELDSTKFNSAMITIGNAFIKFGQAISAAPFWGSSMRAEGIKTLTEGVGMLAEGLPPLMELDANQFNSTLMVIGWGFQKFAEAIAKTPFWGAESRAEGIKVLIEGIKMLSDTVPEFIEKVDSNSFISVVTTIGEGFQKFGEALQSAPFWDTAGKGQGVAALVGSIKDLSDGVVYFSQNVNAVTFEGIMEKIGQGFTSLGNALTAAPMFNSKDRGEGIATVVRSISSLAGGLKKISEIEGLNIEDTLDSLGTAIYNFGQAIGSTGGIFGFGVDKKAQSITVVINSLADIVPTVKELCSIKDHDKFKNVMFSLGYSLQNYAGAINSISWAKAESNSTAMVTVMTGIGNLTPTLQSLCKLDYDRLKNVLFSLGYSLQQFASTVNGLKWNSDDKAKTLDSIIESIVKFGSINFNGLNSVLNAMDKFVVLVANLNKIEFKDKTAFINNLGSLAEMAASNFAAKFKDAVPKIKSAVDDMLKAMREKMRNADTSFETEGKLLGSSVITGFLSKLDDSRRAGESMERTFLKGLKFLDLVVEGEKFAQGFIDGLNHKTGDFETAGENAGEGFARGLRSKISAATDAGKSIGEAAYKAAKKALDEKSPSKKMRQIGSYAGEGFIQGLTDWVNVAIQAGTELGKETTKGLMNSIDDIQNGIDLKPVISPILNLDNLKDQANQIGGILDLSTPIALANNASISFSGGISKMFDELEAAMPDNSNEDVVKAVDNLNTNMMEVMRTLGHLQVVLDTGTMVGELVNPMDQALERNYIMSERGVR